MAAQRKNGRGKADRSAASAKPTTQAGISLGLDRALFGNAGTVLAGYISPEQLATELGCHERTLTRWAAARRGPPRCLVGRRILYRREAVASWLERQEKNFDVLDLKGMGGIGAKGRRQARR